VVDVVEVACYVERDQARVEVVVVRCVNVMSQA